jgi:subtilase family serine protease
MGSRGSPGAKIVLVEASSNSFTNLFNAVLAANKLNPTEVSLSWGGGESSSETSTDSDLAHAGTFYTVSSGDSGHGAQYPAASPNVIAVGGTTLNGCSGTSCSGFKSETTWSGSGGGISAVEPIPSYQSGYTGPVFGASTIAALTGNMRGIPDVSFEANPSTGVSIFDSNSDQGQSGWFTVGGTSIGPELGGNPGGRRGRGPDRAPGRLRHLPWWLQHESEGHHQRHERLVRHRLHGRHRL